VSIKGFKYSEQSLGSQFDLNFIYCGKEDCKPGHSWGPGIRDHYKILYIHQGKGIFKIQDQTYALTAKQGFVEFPNCICYIKADMEDPWTYSWIAFKGMQAETYFNRAGLNASNPVYESSGQLWFEGFFDELMEARQAGKSCDIRYKSILYRYLAELIDIGPGDCVARQTGSHKDAYVRQAIDFIEMNFSRKMSIAELADVIGVDRKYLAVLFNEKLRLSPQSFLLQFRMRKACELMNQMDLTISDISRSVGYSDPLLFSKMFKKMTGLSPKIYRTKVRGSGPDR
jgi:AraC-like DNA-binding protein